MQDLPQRLKLPFFAFFSLPSLQTPSGVLALFGKKYLKMLILDFEANRMTKMGLEKHLRHLFADPLNGFQFKEGTALCKKHGKKNPCFGKNLFT